MQTTSQHPYLNCWCNYSASKPVNVNHHKMSGRLTHAKANCLVPVLSASQCWVWVLCTKVSSGLALATGHQDYKTEQWRQTLQRLMWTELTDHHGQIPSAHHPRVFSIACQFHHLPQDWPNAIHPSGYPKNNHYYTFWLIWVYLDDLWPQELCPDLSGIHGWGIMRNAVLSCL